MPHKSPFTEEIYQAWDAIVTPIGRPMDEDQCERWEALFDKYQVDGKLPLKAADAALITSLGWHCMLWKKNYARANELCEMYLSLPDAESDKVNYVSTITHLAATTCYAGDVEEAVKLLDRIPKGFRPHIFYALTNILSEFDASDRPHHAIRRGAMTYLAFGRGNARRINAVSTAKTNQELSDILWSAFRGGQKHKRRLASR